MHRTNVDYQLSSETIILEPPEAMAPLEAKARSYINRRVQDQSLRGLVLSALALEA